MNEISIYVVVCPAIYRQCRRLEEADATFTKLDPDIFGLIEFMAKNKIRELMFDRFPEYNFAGTDGMMAHGPLLFL